MKIQCINGTGYKLPGQLNDFQLSMYVHLINWKWEFIGKEVGHYWYKGKLIPYDAILPDGCARAAKMPHLYKSVLPHFEAHRKRNPLRIHSHFYHMASSQAANINLFLSILHHPAANAILGAVNQDFKSLAIDQLDHGYCLEYWGGNFSSEATSTGLLGDKSANAGTDSDIAIAYRNHADELCLWLIEHKLTEAEFTTCGGFRSKGRKDKVRHDCTKSFAEIVKNKSFCYYHDKCDYNYWNVTNANQTFFINRVSYGQCPFQGGLNQLWRNQLLALALKDDPSQPYVRASFSVVKHPANSYLDGSISSFSKLIGNTSDFFVFNSDDVIRVAEAQHDKDLNEWAKWYRSLYNL